MWLLEAYNKSITLYVWIAVSDFRLWLPNNTTILQRHRDPLINRDQGLFLAKDVEFWYYRITNQLKIGTLVLLLKYVVTDIRLMVFIWLDLKILVKASLEPWNWPFKWQKLTHLKSTTLMFMRLPLKLAIK